MQARELVELAALVAGHGPLLISGRCRLSESGQQEYWTASKCRLDRWGLALRNYARQLDERGPRWAELTWTHLQPVLGEVLTSEILTRVWTALALAHDRQQNQSDAGPLARSIFAGHQEARHRVLSLLARQQKNAPAAVDGLNQLRRRCERWCDLLIGYLLVSEDVSEMAFDRERAFDFCDSLDHQRRAGVFAPAWQLTLNSLRAAFQHAIHCEAPNADLNERIAAAILCCYPADLFDGSTLPRRLWLARLEHLQADAAGMVEQLLLADLPVRRERSTASR